MALCVGPAAVGADQLTSPAAQAVAQPAMADGQVAAAGCIGRRTSCGCAEAACGCAAGGKCCGPDCCQKQCVVYCDPDDYVCCAKTEKEKVAKECWIVGCEPVCIPKFRLPWECCSKPKCGRVRCINTLGKESYECEECVTTWEAKRVGCGCGKCGRGRGGCSGGCDCGDACCDPGCGCCAQNAAPAPAGEIQTASAELPAHASAAEGVSQAEESASASRWSKLMWWRK